MGWFTVSGNWLAAGVAHLDGTDHDGLQRLATIVVRAHWFLIVLCLVELLYRPFYGYMAVIFAIYLGMVLTLIGLNGTIHYRLWSSRPVTWRWLLALHALDVFLVSAAVVIGGGFSHPFFHLFYYPVLAAFAMIFTSFWLNMFSVTMASMVYLSVSLIVGDGLDPDAGEEKVLLARIAVMYAVVLVANLASRFERSRWERAVKQEREIQRERAGVSRTIHDTVAQTAYMIGLGVENARILARDPNAELSATLEATSRLS